MEDDSTIKKIGIIKLNGSNYRIWIMIIRVMIEVKDMWDTIKQPVPETEMSVKSIDNGIVKDKVIVISKTDCIMDIKTRIVIIEYYKQEVLFKIFYLRIIKE